MNKETRAFCFPMETRADEKHGNIIVGQPIVFNSKTDLGWWEEYIDEGALDDTDMKDVRFLVNHDTDSIPLARSRNNNENSTMQMSVNESGMNIRVDLDIENNARAKELYSAIGRGDVSGMSFMFTVKDDRWENIDSDYPTRHITAIDKIFEVSAVTFPAYEATSISLDARSLESGKASLEEARKALENAREKASRIHNLNERLEALR